MARQRKGTPADLVEHYTQLALERGGTVVGWAAPAVALPEPRVLAHDVSEKVWQAGVVEYAEAAGWATFHVTIAKKSKAGWPDLVIFKHRIVAIELKVMPNRATADQLAWIDRFNAAGAEAFVAYPEDWPRVKAILDECPKSPTNRGEL